MRFAPTLSLCSIYFGLGMLQAEAVNEDKTAMSRCFMRGIRLYQLQMNCLLFSLCVIKNIILFLTVVARFLHKHEKEEVI